MARQRPLAGQRSRARLGVPSPDRPGTPSPDHGRAGAGTAVLDRTSPEPGPAADARRGARRGDLLLLVAVVAVVALALTAGALTLRARGEQRAEQARDAAQAAAERRAVDLLSYDHRHLDRDFARARSGLTGRFAQDYAKTSETVVRPTAEQVKAVVKADVVASSVVRSAQDEVVVLLFVNQTTTSTRLEGPRVDLDRVRMTMRRVGGQWLVAQVRAL